MASPEVLENRQHVGSGKKVTFEEERRDIRRRRSPPPRYPHRKSFRKRSHSFTEGSLKRYKSSSASGSCSISSEHNVLPSKFLLGGNIRDPLNLNSLSDERISEIVNAITPESSPLPTPKHRKAEYKIRVLIPPNITDPLNLNAGVDEREYESRLRKKIRHRKRAPSKKEELPPPSPIPLVAVATTSKATCTKTSNELKEKKEISSSKKEVKASPASPEQKIEHEKKKSSSKEGPSKEKKPTLERQKSSPPPAKKRAPDSPSPPPKNKGPKFKQQNKKFQYGNYDRYYGYRKPSQSFEEDLRIRFLKPEWFAGKKVLDIGCNVGKLTDAIARIFAPKRLIGMDIDQGLIKVARKNLRKKRDGSVVNAFPKSMSILYGSLGGAGCLDVEEEETYPNNISFLCGNYVLDSDALLDTMVPEFDTITCFSTSKWIHLNFGDEGLKRTFRRIYAQLQPGGKFILEAQGLPSYCKKKKLTKRIFDNFNKIKLTPDAFGDFLINEVGFETRELIAIPQHPSRGFQRPLQVFTKPCAQTRSESSPISPLNAAPPSVVINEPSTSSSSLSSGSKVQKDPSKPLCSSSPSVAIGKTTESNDASKLCKPSTSSGCRSSASNSKSSKNSKPKSSPYYTIGGGPTPPGRTPSIGMTPQYDLGTPCYNPEELDIPPGGYYGYNTPGITPGYSGPSPDGGYSNIDPPIQRHHSPVYTGPPPGTFSGASTPGNDESGYTPHYSGYTPSYEGGSSNANAQERRNVYTYSPGNATPSPRTNSAPGTPHTSPGQNQSSSPSSVKSPGNLRPSRASASSAGGTSSNPGPSSRTPSSSTTTPSLPGNNSSQIQQSEISGNTTPHPGTSNSPANSEQHRYLWYGCSSSGGTTPQSGIEDPSSSPKVPLLPSPASQQDSNPSTPVSDERPESASP